MSTRYPLTSPRLLLAALGLCLPGSLRLLAHPLSLGDLPALTPGCTAAEIR